jgi:Na+-driven multidrug efflux pump
MKTPMDPEKQWRQREGTWITWHEVLPVVAFVLANSLLRDLIGFWWTLVAFMILVFVVALAVRYRASRARDATRRAR